MTTTNTLPILIGHNDTLLNLYLHERGEGRTFFTRSVFLQSSFRLIHRRNLSAEQNR